MNRIISHWSHQTQSIQENWQRINFFAVGVLIFVIGVTNEPFKCVIGYLEHLVRYLKYIFPFWNVDIFQYDLPETAHCTCMHVRGEFSLLQILGCRKMAGKVSGDDIIFRVRDIIIFSIKQNRKLFTSPTYKLFSSFTFISDVLYSK